MYTESSSQAINHPWYVQYTYFALKSIFGPIVEFLWVKGVCGLENIPKAGPIILAFNHQSYFDFLCFIAISPRQIHFLSAEKFFSHFFWKHLMKLTGQVKVNRSSRNKESLHITVYDHLQKGKVIGIFPEGTRAPDPVEMLHAFTGVTKYAVQGQVPVIPVGISGAHEVMSRHHLVPRFKKVILIKIGKPIHFEEHYRLTLSENDHRYLTDKIMIEISRLSGKNYSHVGKIERQ